MKKVRIVLSKQAEEVYRYLISVAEKSKINASILRSINSKKDLIRENVHYGDSIPKNLIPLEYKKLGVTNLFRIELPNFWRMLYTLTDGETKIEIIAFVLSIVDHKEYNKKFGYKG
jgi:hypothetical protein